MKASCFRGVFRLVLIFCLAVPRYALAGDDRCLAVRVIDGDTIEISCRGKRSRVRLASIDCPEKKQAYGREAAAFTSRLVKDRPVTIDSRGRDRYSRTIAFITLPDGRCLNHELVRAGLAWWYGKYAPNDPVLPVIEAEARAKKAGLWSDPLARPPWEFRKKTVRLRNPVPGLSLSLESHETGRQIFDGDVAGVGMKIHFP